MVLWFSAASQGSRGKSSSKRPTNETSEICENLKRNQSLGRICWMRNGKKKLKFLLSSSAWCWWERVGPKSSEQLENLERQNHDQNSNFHLTDVSNCRWLYIFLLLKICWSSNCLQLLVASISLEKKSWATRKVEKDVKWAVKCSSNGKWILVKSSHCFLHWEFHLTSRLRWSAENI